MGVSVRVEGMRQQDKRISPERGTERRMTNDWRGGEAGDEMTMFREGDECLERRRGRTVSAEKLIVELDPRAAMSDADYSRFSS